MTLVVRDPQAGSKELEFVRAALQRGQLVVVPTDTVYGFAAAAADAEACARLFDLKARDRSQPIALLLADLGELDDLLPELSELAYHASSALLPGPFTLIVNNPAHRFAWLCGMTPGAIGVRVPEGALPLPAIAATSANEPGAPEVSRPSELPPELLDQCVVAIDVGELPPGNASTVLDLTAWERSGAVTDIVVLRDPADRAPAALQQLDDVRVD